MQNLERSAEATSMSGVSDEVQQRLLEEIKEKEEALNAGAAIFSERPKNTSGVGVHCI